jgi:hypothetical protein
LANQDISNEINRASRVRIGLSVRVIGGFHLQELINLFLLLFQELFAGSQVYLPPQYLEARRRALRGLAGVCKVMWHRTSISTLSNPPVHLSFRPKKIPIMKTKNMVY